MLLHDHKMTNTSDTLLRHFMDGCLYAVFIMDVNHCIAVRGFSYICA